MKKSIACLIIVLMVLSLFGAMAGAQISRLPSPLPIFGPPISIPLPPSFIDLPRLLPITYNPCYVPGLTKLNLSVTEAAALSNMTPGTSTLVKFYVPYFFSNQPFIWRSSDPRVASVTALRCYAGRINANRSGTALITVATPDGSFSFSFLVTVK